MTEILKSTLLGQLRTAWALTAHHLDGLTDEAFLWRPAAQGLHGVQGADGRWIADWPDRETYDLGPPPIAWTIWHLVFWWSMVLDHSFGEARLTREDVACPSDAASARATVEDLHDRWRAALETLPDADWTSARLTRWPFAGRPFADVAAWANVELTKNAAEIGYARFLYGVRDA